MTNIRFNIRCRKSEKLLRKSISAGYLLKTDGMHVLVHKFPWLFHYFTKYVFLLLYLSVVAVIVHSERTVRTEEK